jgi:hypothetical protein
MSNFPNKQNYSRVWFLLNYGKEKNLLAYISWYFITTIKENLTVEEIM